MFDETQITKSTLERILFETNVQYVPQRGETFSDRCSDLSVGGMYLKTKHALRVNETLLIAFSIPFEEGEYEVSCQARVAWTNYDHEKLKIDYPPGVGLEFLELSSECPALLAGFINKYDENKKMNMICAWCGKHLGMRNGPYGKTSHGICGQCKETYL
jgi:Tfp pilus assembly protein PilZ